MAGWINSDGLYVKFGTEEGVSSHPAGEFKTFNGSNEQIIEVVIDLADLTETETILNDVVWVPNNAHVTWVETVCLVAAADGTAIDVGLIDQDRATEIDYDGFLAAFPTAEMAQVGETRRFYETHTIPTTMTGTGALIGQENTNTGYISASMTDSTSYTAGRVKIRIAYIPKGIDVV
jgi:hypothetical protein